MIDLYARERTLSINGKFNLKTQLGGFSSLLIIIFSGIITYFFGKEFFERNSISLNKYPVSLSVATEEKWNTTLYFLFSFPKKYDNMLRISYSPYDLTSMIIKVPECNEYEYSVFYSIPQNDSLNYYCGNTTDQTSLTKAFIITTCSIKDDKTCPNQIIREKVPVFSAFLFYSYVPDDYENHLKKFILYFNNSINNLHRARGSAMKFISDEGYFTSDYKTGYFYSLYQIIPNIDSKNIMSVILNFPEFNIYEQTSKKIPEILAKILVLSKIIYFLLLFINNLVSEYLILKIMLQTFCNDNDVDFIYKCLSKNEEMIVKSVNSEVQISTIEQQNNTDEKIKKIYNEFNFKNYILFSYLSWLFQTPENFKNIYNKLTYYLSIEKTITKNSASLVTYHNESIFQKIDFFSEYKTFLFNGNTKFNTKLGFCTTIIFFISMILVYYFIGQDFLIHTPKFSTRSLTQLDVRNFTIDSPIMASMHKELATYSRLVTNNGKQIFPGNECSDKEIEDYYGKDFKRNVTNYYYCSNMNIGFPQFNNEYFELNAVFNSANCSELLLSKLVNGSCPTIAPDPELEIYTEFGSITKVYNISNYGEPIQKYSRVLSKKQKAKGRYSLIKYYYRTIIMYDNNPLYSNNIYDEIPTIYNERILDYYLIYLFYFSIAVDKGFKIVIIKYKKIPEMLANSGSIITIITFTFYLISYLYYDYFYDRIFYEYFLEDDTALDVIMTEYQKTILTDYSNKFSILHQYSTYFPTFNENQFDLKKLHNRTENIRKSKIQLTELSMQIKNTEFTMKKYLKKFICCCTKNRNMDIIVNEILMKYVSFENLMKNNSDNSSSIKNYEKLTFTSTSFLQKIDFLSGNKLLYIQNKRSFTTAFGGMLSIAYLIIIIFLFFVFGQNYLEKKNSTIDYYNIDFNDYENNVDNAKFELNVPIIFGYSKELNATTRFVCQGEFAPCPINPVDCTETEFSLHNITINSSLIYKCVNLRDIFSKLYELDKSLKNTIFIIACSKYKEYYSTYAVPYDQTCKQDPDPDRIVRVEYYLNLTYFNESLSSDFFSSIIEKRSLDGKYNKLMGAQYTIQQNILFNDQNAIIPDQNYYLFTSLIDAKYSQRLEKSLSLLEMYLQFSRGIMKTTRKYQKLPEMLAQVLSIVSIVKVFLNIFYIIVSNYLYLKYLSKYYFIKHDSEYINSIFNLNYAENSKLQIHLKEEEIMKNFTLKNYLYASYLKFLCKKKFQVNQCRLLKEEIEKFISIQEYIKSLKSKMGDYNNTNPQQDESLNKIDDFEINQIDPQFKNNYIKQVVEIRTKN